MRLVHMVGFRHHEGPQAIVTGRKGDDELDYGMGWYVVFHSFPLTRSYSQVLCTFCTYLRLVKRLVNVSNPCPVFRMK